MTSFSIYHVGRFGKTQTIRFNLRAVRRLLPEYQIEGFGLTTRQREKMQRRVDIYVALGGKVDLQPGVEATPERIIPPRVIPATRLTKREVIPARIEPAKPEVLPSIDHLPNHNLLDRVLRMELVGNNNNN